MIALINLGNSNIQSVINVLDHLSISYIKADSVNDVKKCDRIIVLDEGKVLGQGTYDYISKQPYFEGLFH